MSNLTNKNILLCVTGGIAAYKAAELVRLLKTSNAFVKVLMTKSAQEFITPLTMQALSGEKVHTDLLSTEAEAAMGHIELAKWCDLIVIAPCSANSLSKIAEGRGDDLLSAVCLATESKIFIAPAMNQAMWKDKRTQKNLSKSIKAGLNVIGPASGEQACGDVGDGRMTEPADIVSEVEKTLKKGLLTGKKVIITAGPTQEMIDPVRYISNKSSGKMGFSLAEEVKNQGALVTLISGPVNLKTPEKLLYKYKNLCETNDPVSFKEKIDEKFLNLDEIKQRIVKKEDIIGRDDNFNKIEIDASFPVYLQNNINLYKDWIDE